MNKVKMSEPIIEFKGRGFGAISVAWLRSPLSRSSACQDGVAEVVDAVLLGGKVWLSERLDPLCRRMA